MSYEDTTRRKQALSRPSGSRAAEDSGPTLPLTSLSLSSALPGDKRHQGLLFLEG